MKYVFGVLILSLLFGCANSIKELSNADKDTYLISGDEIASNAQAILLQNVSQAMKAGGVINAVNFCSENAIPLTDSISTLHAKSIQRLSDRNRNPINALKSGIDQKAWAEIRASMTDSTKAKHLILQEENSVYYYKAISIAMPTCLKCHGDQTVDIDPKALKIINEKYPEDKATGYKMGDLRGLWKIKMN